MGYGRETKVELIDPFSVKFEKYLQKFDPSINSGAFLSIARSIVAKKFKSLPDSATSAQRVALQRNINFEIATTMAHDPESLLTTYYNLKDKNLVHAEEESARDDRILEKERFYAAEAGFDPIEPTPDIDRAGRNGMTRIAEIIMISDDVASVRLLVEEAGASPVAKCGGYTPLELAEQLGRDEISDYLRNFAKMSA